MQRNFKPIEAEGRRKRRRRNRGGERKKKSRRKRRRRRNNRKEKVETSPDREVTKERGKKREKGKREYSKIYHRERCEEVRHMEEREREVDLGGV